MPGSTRKRDFDVSVNGAGPSESVASTQIAWDYHAILARAWPHKNGQTAPVRFRAAEPGPELDGVLL